ncbi:MAG: P-loop NTPase, partial [Thermodesulfovibrionales bacterium]
FPVRASRIVRKAGRIIAIGGGKGGVGKSIVAICMGTELARRGEKVVLADMDLGAANLHTYLGILGKTSSLADFILGRVSTLKEILLDTSVKNMRLISGSQFLPGMANPAHWTKLKLMRHLQEIETDTLIIDLGAGVHLNTLDFFGLSDMGVIVTMPEAGAVMNAYGFLKGALYRKIQNVFKRHSGISSVMTEAVEKKDSEGDLNLEWFSQKVEEFDPSLSILITEIKESFTPFLVLNRISNSQSSILVKNLLSLAKNRLGISLEHLTDLPDSPEVRNYLLNVPEFLSTPAGRKYLFAIESIVDRMNRRQLKDKSKKMLKPIRHDFTDEEIEEVSRLVDRLDDHALGRSTRNQWKLRLFFKPFDVVQFLVHQGVDNPIFFDDLHENRR